MSPRLSFEELAKQNVSALLNYATDKLYLNDLDRFYVQNQLLDLLDIDEPTQAEKKGVFDVYKTLSELSDYAINKKLCKQEDKLLFETKIMGYLTPNPSKVVDMFDNIARYSGTMEACKMLNKLSEDSTYIRRPDIDKNIYWDYEAPRGNITVSINLAKPEKTPEQVKRAKEAKTGYPKCVLCAENIGFKGNAAFPARQNLRYIPFELDGEEWMMQFSPYVYFKEHIIVFSAQHRPMNITAATFKRMLEFVDIFPDYFLGSNATLPIVGGSILAHDHYQGGKKVLPMFKRSARKRFLSQKYPNVNVSIVDWYNSVIRLESKDFKQISEFAEDIRKTWFDYEDKDANIIPFTLKDNERIQHNAITPVCSINADGEYELDFILRNNRTDETHPFGIFHPTEDLHNIKQEAIGIIEVMGLFILPGRLSKEANGIKDILTGTDVLDFKSLADEGNALHKHLGMIAQLVTDYGVNISQEKAEQAVTDYINNACSKILDTTAVFKNTEDGQIQFERFVNSIL